MLDINLIRQNPQQVVDALRKRMFSVDFSNMLGWDEERRRLTTEVESLKARRNKVSSDIPALKKRGEDPAPLFAEMKEVGGRIKELDEAIGALEVQIRDFLLPLPNIPADDVVAGGKENNSVLRVVGEKRNFDFAFKNHVDLVTNLGLVDYERGVRLGGAGFWMYTGLGAQLEWGLLNYFVEEHLKAGYQFMLPPHMLIEECGVCAGQFPKFRDDVFHLEKGDRASGQFLLPTAETALVNIHRDELLEDAMLPLKYFAYTPCFRKEAGSYRAQERGMIRGHQFNKVELFQYARPEDSGAALEEMVGMAEALVQGLGLHYRVAKLAAGDCSDSMAQTFDIEVWIPSMGEYKEVSSASNAHAYQARRGNIRFRRKEGKKTEFVHTLNASGLATSRILPAIVETHQQSDGSVIVPEVLRKWVGVERLRA